MHLKTTIDFREFTVVIGKKVTQSKLLAVKQKIDDKKIHGNF